MPLCNLIPEEIFSEKKTMGGLREQQIPRMKINHTFHPS